MNTSSYKILFTKFYNLAYDKYTSVFDLVLYLFNCKIRKLKELKHSEKKNIVYICDGIMLHIPRLARWIKDYEFTTILISNKSLYVEVYSEEFIDIKILFRNKYHLKRIIKQLKKVYVYHVTAPKSYYPDMIRQMVKAPFILDMHDVYSCYYGLNPDISWIKEELIYEKRCLQLSDGVIGVSLEPNAALRKYGKPKPPTIYFPFYCDDKLFKNNSKQLNEDDIHLVYAGGIAGSHRNKSHYGAIQFHNLINLLSEQKIHFHIYSSPSAHITDKTEYEQIDASNRFFHFHKPVMQEKLIEELSNYHFGILPLFNENTSMSTEKSKYATSLKIFNYIEAGLPVLVSCDLEYQSWIVNRYNAGIVITPDDLSVIKKIVTSVDYKIMVDNLIKNREELSLKKHIPRLIKFYNQIANN